MVEQMLITYTITDQASTTGNIAAKALTATASAANKVYDGTTTATTTLTFTGLNWFRDLRTDCRINL